MKNNSLRTLQDFGQSIWMDFIRRKMMLSGEMKRLIERDGIRGVTSNPAIFETAIGGSRDYDDEIRSLALEGRAATDIYEALTVRDVQMAADLFLPLYDGSGGRHGFVSLEVNPHLARDGEGTIAEARHLWKVLDRPNVMIKIPATRQGLACIRRLTGEGINVNVTLLFGLPRYRAVAEAYIGGLEDRAAAGRPLRGIASVASFFLSRIDVLVDGKLQEIMAARPEKRETAEAIRGQVAVASARCAYQIYQDIFDSERFRRLADQGARPQRLLWASTSTKNPEFSDIKYVEALIGPDTVNTLPRETLDAYRDHGRPLPRLADEPAQANAVLDRLGELGIDIDQVTRTLVEQGIEKFNAPYDRSIDSLEESRQAALKAAVNRQTITVSDHAQRCDLGLVGLGAMGRNFALNLADHGFSVAGYNADPVDFDPAETTPAQRRSIHVTDGTAALCRLLRRPRTVILLVPAGDPVDAVIKDLTSHLEAGDLIIDSGNSHFSDTDRRAAALVQKGLLYMGMGMSGGASGARHGPSLMPGGPQQAYERVKGVLEAVAAKADGRPCVAHLGPGSAGHYVKMVHNGIEYGLMQLIAETYDLMKRGLGLAPDELQAIYDRWRRGVLDSYLMEITADIFQQRDERTGDFLIDRILDQAKQKGTGEWTAEEALRLQVPVLNINTAVMMRHLSGDAERRLALSASGEAPPSAIAGEKEPFVDRLENALYVAALATYAQGMDLLLAASRKHAYALDLETVARVWTGGCIIRARLLDEIQRAYRERPDLPSLLGWPPFGEAVAARLNDLRTMARAAAVAAIPAPGLSMALAYIDAYRSESLPANLIMAQRDYFGSHTYERVDADGTFHTRWEAR